MTDVASFLSANRDKWIAIENSKVRCVLTGHEMPARMEAINEHMKGKRYKSALKPPTTTTPSAPPPSAATKKSPKKQKESNTPSTASPAPAAAAATATKSKRKRDEHSEAPQPTPNTTPKKVKQSHSDIPEISTHSGSGDTTKSSKKEFGDWADPNRLFVGQLSFKTTKEAVEEHFRKTVGNAEIKVRLLTDKKTKKSRGMAFVEFGDVSVLQTAIGLHHSMLDGRRINVERTCGGGGTSHKRIRNLTSLRNATVKQTKKALLENITEMVKANQLGKDDIDAHALTELCKLDLTTARKALKQYATVAAKKDNTDRRAYLIGLVQKLQKEEIPLVVDTVEDDDNGDVAPVDTQSKSPKHKSEKKKGQLPKKTK
eukprot:c3566_g1_i1.p1 GENE.c3566_g1_i1~~c3566_g1_i1.p1  ORF type:complete len:372 (+),score=121.27 c3566_g1_i1:29-1144(+)